MSLLVFFVIIRCQFRTDDTIYVIAWVKLQNVNSTANVYLVVMIQSL